MVIQYVVELVFRAPNVNFINSVSTYLNYQALQFFLLALHSVWVIWDSFYVTLDKNKHGTWDSVYWVMKKPVGIRGQSR